MSESKPLPLWARAVGFIAYCLACCIVIPFLWALHIAVMVCKGMKVTVGWLRDGK
jgi:hypothetical protein